MLFTKNSSVLNIKPKIKKIAKNSKQDFSENVVVINEESNDSPDFKIRREENHNNSDSDSDIDDKKIDIGDGISIDHSNPPSGKYW